MQAPFSEHIFGAMETKNQLFPKLFLACTEPQYTPTLTFAAETN